MARAQLAIAGGFIEASARKSKNIHTTPILYRVSGISICLCATLISHRSAVFDNPIIRLSRGPTAPALRRTHGWWVEVRAGVTATLEPGNGSMDLVHAIQLERGCSCAWVGGGGKSEYFQKLVMTHREQANAALQREGGRLEPQHRKEIMERLSYLRDTADRSTAAVLSVLVRTRTTGRPTLCDPTGYSDTVKC